MADIEADVVIVGSGVAGALIADTLAGAGVKVAILEAGDEVDRSEAVDRFQNALIKTPESAYPVGPDADHPLSWDPDYWYRQSGPEQVPQHLYQGGRRNHLALARHRNPHVSQRFSAGKPLQPRRRLAGGL